VLGPVVSVESAGPRDDSRGCFGGGDGDPPEPRIMDIIPRGKQAFGTICCRKGIMCWRAEDGIYGAIADATHVLDRDGLKPNPYRRHRAAARVLKTAKDAVWMSVINWTRPLRNALGLRKKSRAG
jgi:hypothetical protein